MVDAELQTAYAGVPLRATVNCISSEEYAFSCHAVSVLQEFF